MIGLVLGVLVLALICLSIAHWQLWQERDELEDRRRFLVDTVHELNEKINGNDDYVSDLAGSNLELKAELASVRKTLLISNRERDEAIHELAGLKEVNAAQLAQLVESDQKSMKLRNALRKLKAYCESWEGA